MGTTFDALAKELDIVGFKGAFLFMRRFFMLHDVVCLGSIVKQYCDFTTPVLFFLFAPNACAIVVSICDFSMPRLASDIAILMSTFGVSSYHPKQKVPLEMTVLRHVHSLKLVFFFFLTAAHALSDQLYVR